VSGCYGGDLIIESEVIHTVFPITGKSVIPSISHAISGRQHSVMVSNAMKTIITKNRIIKTYDHRANDCARIQAGRHGMDALCQPVECDPAQYCTSRSYHRVLVPVVAWLVGSHPDNTWFPVELVQSPHLSGFTIARSLDLRGSAGGTGLAEPRCCARTGVPPDGPEHTLNSFWHRDVVCHLGCPHVRSLADPVWGHGRVSEQIMVP